jgi:hypothetical protein
MTVMAPSTNAGTRPASAAMDTLVGSASAVKNVLRRSRNATAPTTAIATTHTTSTASALQSTPNISARTAVDAIMAMLVIGASPHAAMPRSPAR